MAYSRKNLNFNEICRLCLSHSSLMSSIFSSPCGFNTISLPSRIMAFTTIKMKPGDGLPGLICQSCLFTIEQVFEFKQKCEQSDFVLRKYLTVESKKSEIKPVTKENQHINNDFDSKHKGFSNKKGQQDGDNIGSPFLDRNCDNQINKGNGADYYYNRKQMGNVLNEVNKLEEDQSLNIGDKCSIFNGNCEIENIVLVVDPNTEALDDITDNENDEYNYSENSRDSQDSEALDDITDNENDEYNNSENSRNKDRLDHLRRNSPVKIVDTGKTFVLYHCNSCNKPFSDRNAFERHLEIHNQEPYFPCDFCKMFFEDHASLKSHWHSHAPSGYLVCMICGEAYKDVSELLKHTKLHELLQPYPCYVCNKAFTFECDLRKHIQTHDGASPYYCNICKKTFARSGNLRKHEKSHIGARPFGCDECLKRFTTRADLTRHMLTHSGIKPFSCNVCGLGFSRRDKMLRHNKLHERHDRRLFCEKCMLSFSNRKVLASHYKINHPDPEGESSSHLEKKIT